MARDGAGNVFLADPGANVVRKLAPDLSVSVIAGGGSSTGDGVRATTAALRTPTDVAVDPSGGVLVVENEGHRVRRVNPDGTITTLAGTGQVASTGDGGQARAASLAYPEHVAVDSSGNIFIADTGVNKVRKVATSGVITTVAGTGTAGFSGDGGPATAAQLNWPSGLAVGGNGNLYIADRWNDRIRVVQPNGVINTVAGSANRGLAGDGGAATGAMLNRPTSVTVDSSGSLYITDKRNDRVRKVTNGIITSVGSVSTPYTALPLPNGSLLVSREGGPIQRLP
jgi:hypothetical protein